MEVAGFVVLSILVMFASNSHAEYTMSINFFNVDNPDEVIAGELPIMSQKGPYVYREERLRMNEEQEGDMVSFGEYKEYKFSSDRSGAGVPKPGSYHWRCLVWICRSCSAWRVSGRVVLYTQCRRPVVPRSFYWYSRVSDDQWPNTEQTTTSNKGEWVCSVQW